MDQQLHSFWARNKVIYHIYLRSFYDTTGDGIGDLRGIIKKLSYLNDGTENSLGIGGIWISPFFSSPMADFGYDVADYCSVDPLFGTMKDFDELLLECKKRDIAIIIDFIPNHTSSKHPWFIESSSSRSNPKRDWYIWKDPKPDGSPPNNWLARFGGSAWTFDKKTGQYYYHSFLPEQPDLNWHNPQVREAMFQCLSFWLDKGVKGVRIDAVEHLYKDPAFKDEPLNPEYNPSTDDPYHQLLHIYTRGRKESVQIVKQICDFLKQYDDVYVISEAKISPKLMAEWQRVCGYLNYSPLNFPFVNLPWDAHAYRSYIDIYDKEIGEIYWPNYFLSNHDEPRVVARVGKERARILAMMLLTLRGTPFLYYGDEIGIGYVPIPPDKIQDPYEKRVPGKGLGRDPVRTPLPWNDGVYGGFSIHEPWLPLNPDYKTCNIETQQKDKRSMLSLYKMLIHYRNRSKSLRLGTYQSIDCGNRDILAYERLFASEKHLIMLNFSSESQTVHYNGRGILICTTYLDRKMEKSSLSSFLLRPYEGCLFLCEVE
ncbi:MAG: oligo-1,6-glucosidase [Patescibacteria group bacterium]|nr:MAG: oligo-1,6-glucosidase [Patescibacteria group bacterium]